MRTVSVRIPKKFNLSDKHDDFIYVDDDIIKIHEQTVLDIIRHSIVSDRHFSTILIGPEEYFELEYLSKGEIQKSILKTDEIVIARFDQFKFAGSIFDLEVRIVPWMRGVLLL